MNYVVAIDVKYAGVILFKKMKLNGKAYRYNVLNATFMYIINVTRSWD